MFPSKNRGSISHNPNYLQSVWFGFCYAMHILAVGGFHNILKPLFFSVVAWVVIPFTVLYAFAQSVVMIAILAGRLLMHGIMGNVRMLNDEEYREAAEKLQKEMKEALLKIAAEQNRRLRAQQEQDLD